MKITIGIVNYNRSKVVSPFPQRSGNDYLFLLPNCITALKNAVDKTPQNILKIVQSQINDDLRITPAYFPEWSDTKTISAFNHQREDIDLMIIDFNSTDHPVDKWIDDYWPFDYMITKVNKPFSPGLGRNILINQFSRDILILLDADMIVPTNFIQIVALQATKGYAVMPLYQRYVNPEHTKTSDGIGYGNLVIRSDVVSFLRQKFTGKPYPELHRWGGEDVFVANAIKNSGKWSIKRELIPGFMHQWHPKTGDFYKKTEAVDKV
jgi:glycosyltransferase involved in cell wall biosynthesis